MPPRRSRRVLPRVLQRLTGDNPEKTPALANRIQLVELLGDNSRHVQPAVRPLMGGGRKATGATVGLVAVCQVRATANPVWVMRYRVYDAIFVHHYRVGPDLISGNRSPFNVLDQWRFPAGEARAVVEVGTTTANLAVLGIEATPIDDDIWHEVPLYLEPGEVLSFHDILANQGFQAAFQWYEVPL